MQGLSISHIDLGIIVAYVVRMLGDRKSVG